MFGIFDSGVGGLTVVKEIIKSFPQREIIYFGDTARLPYGTKGADFVKKYSFKITEWLLLRNSKVIIVACHTSSAIASDFLKRKFKKVPIFEMVYPAIKDALSKTKSKRIGIIGTPGTIKSKSYEKRLKKIDKNIKIFPIACPLFVPLVEEGLVSGNITEEIVEKYLKSLKKKNIDTLILACTHYPILMRAIKKSAGKKIKIVNPAECLGEEIKDFFKKNKEIEKSLKKGKNHKFYFSDEPYNFKKISKLCFKKSIEIKVKDPFN